MTFGCPVPLGRAAPNLSGAEAIAALEAALRDKDNTIQAQYAELTELRRQHALALAGVKHWRAKAIAFNPALAQESA